MIRIVGHGHGFESKCGEKRWIEEPQDDRKTKVLKTAKNL